MASAPLPSEPTETDFRPRAPRLDQLDALALLALGALVAWTYGPSCALYFDAIDDPSLVQRVADGEPVTPQFRPLYGLWNGFLLQVFGLEPLGWRVAGVALHLANSALVYLLARWLITSRAAALGAGAVFAAYYSGHEAVLWIAANCGLLSVLFALVAACTWTHHVLRPRGWTWALTLAATAGAMGSKQDCVLLAPLLVGIESHLRGARALLARRSLARYGVLAALGAVWLALAYRPQVWAQSPSVGQYALGIRSLLELVGDLGLLFAIGRVELEPTSWPALASGAAVIAALAALALASPERRVLLSMGFAVALFAILPVLPGHLPVAGTRYAYPASIGVALIAGGVLAEAWSRAARLSTPRAGRALLATLFAAWIAVQALAIHSITEWRFATRSRNFETLIRSTRSLRASLAPATRAWVLAPVVWNPLDYQNGVDELLGPEVHVARCDWLAWEAELAPALARGGRLDPADHAIFAADRDGTLSRIGPGARVPIDRLRENAREYVPGSPADHLPLVELEFAPR